MKTFYRKPPTSSLPDRAEVESPQAQSRLDTVWSRFGKRKSNTFLSGRFLAAHKARCPRNTSRSRLPRIAPTKHRVRNHRRKDAGRSPAALLQLGARPCRDSRAMRPIPSQSQPPVTFFINASQQPGFPDPPGGLPGARRSGRAGQPRDPSSGCSEAATPMWYSRLGYSRRATVVAPARSLRGRGATDWAAGAAAAAAQPPADPARRAQQQFRLRRPAETAEVVRGAGPGRRTGEGRQARGRARSKFSAGAPSRGAPIGQQRASALARTDVGRGREEGLRRG